MAKTMWQEWEDVACDEERWRDHWERGLLKAEHVADFVLRLWFEEQLDVSIYELDFAPLFIDQNPGGVFEVLREPERFQLVIGDHTLAWLNPETGVNDANTIDLAPECVRFFCERYGRLIKATGEAAHPERMAV